MDEIALREFLLVLINERDTQYQQRFEAQEKAVTAALDAAKEAVAKAETAAEKRFDAVNEFRAQLADQASTFMPRNEYNVQYQSLNEKIDAGLKTNGDKIEAAFKTMTERITSEVKVLSARLDRITTSTGESLGSLNVSNAEVRGHSAGLNAGWGYLVGALGIVTSVIVLIVKLR